MIIRVVRLNFFSEKIETAEKHLTAIAPKVRAMQGCTFLEISQDIHNPANWTTYSHWDSELDLNAYRQSDTFKTFWGEIKPLFAKPAIAWSSHPQIILS